MIEELDAARVRDERALELVVQIHEFAQMPPDGIGVADLNRRNQ